MTVETFLANFGYLADAPNGVRKLRELILQLAVQGKLVPQDPKDEPASVLLKRIEAEKRRLIKEGKIKSRATIPPIGADEIPYDLPNGWEWERLGNLSTLITDGTHFTPKYTDRGIPFLSIKNISKGFLDFSDTKFISEEEHTELVKRCKPERDDILLCRIGTLGSATLVNVDREFSIFVSVGLIKYPTDLISPRYLEKVMNSPLFVGQYHEIKAGGSHTNKLNLNAIPTLKTPLPPLAEQHRIVAKVDQLMVFCDELEARQRKQQEGRVRLNNAALDALLNAGDPADFATHWQRVCTNFDLLYDHPDTIAKLRAAILQLAVQGKLVPQVNSELWRDGMLGDVVESSEAGWSPQCENRPCVGDEWGVLKVSAVSWGKFDPNENKALPGYMEARPRWSVRKGDFLISRANTAELVARSVVVDQDHPRLLMSDKIIRVNFKKNADPNYFSLVNNSPFSREYYARVAGGTSSSMKNVSRQQILALPVTIPPFDEQHRIVAKVDQLMTLCDVLEDKLNQARQQNEKLMEASVRQLLVA